MILTILTGTIVVLTAANIIIRRDSKKELVWNKEGEKTRENENYLENEKKQLVEEKSYCANEEYNIKKIENFENDEDKRELKEEEVSNKTYMDLGQIMSNKQKINLMVKRINTLENVVKEMAKSENNSDTDFEKIDFRIKVLEQEIEKLKNPQEQNKNTFYGKENDKMEETIKSLVYNTRKK